MPIRIAAAQTEVSVNIAANGANIRTILQLAADRGVRVVVFCEGALSSYAKRQITTTDWSNYPWDIYEAELQQVADTCRQLGIYAVMGGVHRLPGRPPHNSLFVIDDAGGLLARYDKRWLSHTELQGWYTPGVHPVVFAVDGYRFGCATCIESQFSEVFREYEEQSVDAVLFASYGIPALFQLVLPAHAALNCLWIVAATNTPAAASGAASIIGPDGAYMAQCDTTAAAGLAHAVLDRDDPAYDIPLNKARPWRASARQGDIYRERM